jgi:hypothetical protein
MYKETKQDKSVLQFLRTLYADTPFIKVEDGYPEEDFTVPTVALEVEEINGSTFEMGNPAFKKTRNWYVDIYAANKAQRNEIAYRLLYALEDKIPVFDYDQGFDNPPKIGALDPLGVQLKVIKVLPELTELMYYRSVVIFATDYNEI